MAIALKERSEQQSARDTRVDAKVARPAKGHVDYSALIDAAMRQYPKTRARLAK